MEKSGKKRRGGWPARTYEPGERVAMSFRTALPELSHWPPSSFAVPGANWQEHPAAADFQRIPAVAEVMSAFR